MLRCSVEQANRSGSDQSLDSVDSFTPRYGGNQIKRVSRITIMCAAARH